MDKKTDYSTTVYATGKGYAEWFSGFTGQVRFYTNGSGCVADNAIRTRAVYSITNWADFNIFSWLPGGETSPVISETPASTTSYSLNYLDLIGCQSTVNLGITIAGPHIYYVDNDRDGFGSSVAVTLCSATAPPGYSTNNTDCNDNDANVHASPTINIQAITPICSGKTALITVSSSATSPTYSWYSDGAGQNLLQSAVAPSYTTPALTGNTIYYVLVADGTVGCASALTAASVGVSPSPSVAPIIASGGTNVCSGAKITLTDATSGGMWSASSNVANVSATGVVTFGTVTATTIVTIYYTVISNTCSATVSSSFTVNKPLNTQAITGIMTICGVGGTTNLSDAATGGSWSSSNVAIAIVSTTGVVTGKATGSVMITYSLSSGGCKAAVSTTVLVKSSPVVAAISGNNVLIKGASISLTDVTKNGTWSSSNTAVATVSASGAVKGISAGACVIYYTATSSSCTAVASKAITVYKPLSASVTAGKILCNGGTATITVNVTGGSGGYQYSLNVGKFQANNMYTVTAGTYVIVVKDNMAEQFTISGIGLSQPAALGLKLISETNVSSKGATNGSIAVDGTGGTLPYQYSINGATYQNSGLFSNKPAGAYSVWVQDACAAKKNLSVTIGPNGPKKNAIIADSSDVLLPASDEVHSDANEKAVVYPNPSISGFTLELKSSSNETVEMIVMDVMGHTLYQTRGSATGSYKFGGNFVKGMYFVTVVRKAGIKTLKVIKQ